MVSIMTTDRPEYFSCPKCGSAEFADGQGYACLSLINFETKQAEFEPHVLVDHDYEPVEGWYCSKCGYLHPEWRTIAELYKQWGKEDIEPYL
jgi:ribosomal protein S27AE